MQRTSIALASFRHWISVCSRPSPFTIGCKTRQAWCVNMRSQGAESAGTLSVMMCTRRGSGLLNRVVCGSFIVPVSLTSSCLLFHDALLILLDFAIVDEETARFIYKALPRDSHLTVEELQSALQDVHRRRPTASLETRVAEALGSLGLQTAA